MSNVLESSGRGVELSLSWMRNDLCHSEYLAAFRADTFQPVYDTDDRPAEQLWQQGRRQAFIGRALDDSGWRIGSFCLGRADDKPSGHLRHRPLQLATEDGSNNVDSYEILCRSHVRSFLGRPHRWIPWVGCDEVPRCAVIGGCIRSKPVFIARAVVGEVPVAGEFQPFRQRAEFASDGRIYLLTKGFDVLALQDRTVHPDIAKVFRV